MFVSVATETATVKLTKIEYRTRYDIAGYETGGLSYGYASTKGDGYLVSTPEGKVLGCVYKWSDGLWTASKLHPSINLVADYGEGPMWAFSACLYNGGKTRAGAVAKLLKVSK